jgi:hypothetical protein
MVLKKTLLIVRWKIINVNVNVLLYLFFFNNRLFKIKNKYRWCEGISALNSKETERERVPLFVWIEYLGIQLQIVHCDTQSVCEIN